MKPYCTQNNGDCKTCSLVNYNRDCHNNPIHGGKREGAGAKKLTPPNARRRNILVTDEEYQKVKEYIKLLREEKKDEN
jgi:hypothetical protein